MSAAYLAEGEISVARSYLDADAISRDKIKQANIAIWECVQSLVVHFRNPVAPTIFGADWETLEAFAKLSRSDVLRLSHVGLPLFSLRTNSPEIQQMIKGNEYDANSILRLLLMTFSEEVPLRDAGA